MSESEVLALLCEGLDTREIAERMVVSGSAGDMGGNGVLAPPVLWGGAGVAELWRRGVHR